MKQSSPKLPSLNSSAGKSDGQTGQREIHVAHKQTETTPTSLHPQQVAELVDDNQQAQHSSHARSVEGQQRARTIAHIYTKL